MLSYRHEFHAGNHADMLKHAVLALTIQVLSRKEKPFTLYETHAGAGWYLLDSDMARKTGEAATGVRRIIHAPDVPEALQSWMSLVRSSLEDENLYPGSPAVSTALTRPSDEVVLCELHPTEIEELRHHFRRDEKVHVHFRDGFEGIPGMCPPANRRGAVLIDPSYEGGKDYESAPACMKTLDRKWPEGTFLAWYPILGSGKDRSGEMLASLESHAFRGLWKIELLVDDVATCTGMAGSGMVVANPPWQMDVQAKAVMPWILKALSPGKHARWRFEWLREQA